MTTNSEHKSLLPYDYYRTVVESGRPDILFHWHPEIEINYIYEGSARFHILTVRQVILSSSVQMVCTLFILWKIKPM